MSGRPALLIAGLATTLALGVGCSASREAKRANYELRLERETLQERVTQLEGELAELTAKLEGADTGAISSEKLAALPAAAGIDLLGTSGFRRDGGLVLRVAARDGRGRSLQVVGTMRVELLRTADDANAGDDGASDIEPIVTRTLSPIELRKSYREGLGGASYEIRFGAETLPPPAVVGGAADNPDARAGRRGLIAVVSLDDELTGVRHEASAAYRPLPDRVTAR